MRASELLAHDLAMRAFTEGLHDGVKRRGNPRRDITDEILSEHWERGYTRGLSFVRDAERSYAEFLGVLGKEQCTGCSRPLVTSQPGEGYCVCGECLEGHAI